MLPIETARLRLRELTHGDFDVLFEILSDLEVMRHYPRPKTADEVRAWIQRNIDRYAECGFGLWAVELKATGQMIGECGITLQPIRGEMLPEVGYHIHPAHQRQGYASEAAAACIRCGFETLGFPAVYSYMKHTNEASQRTAMKNGLRFVEKYADPVNTFTCVYAISREEWLAMQ